nr:hypothetical protein [Tanacetum cinerariifolium]
VNASNYKAAGKLLMAKRKHLYWTPCATHCIDLMLEDIGKIQRKSTGMMRMKKLVMALSNVIESFNLNHKQKGIKGPTDMFFTPPPEQVVKNHKDGKLKQSTINDICKKELRDKACKELANWFYDVGLPFNAVNHDSFRIALEAVSEHGTGFKPPSYHEVRVPYLAKVVKSTDEMEIGEQNVVQVVTVNASNYKAAGKLLMAKRKHLYWTPCAAHCIDLMLEDIGKIQRASNNKIFYCLHYSSFNTNSKKNLRKKFTSDTWTKIKYAKEQAGKHVTAIVAMPTFWSNILYILKLTGPIVSVLRLVDGEKKQSMDPNIEEDLELSSAMYQCVMRLIANKDDQSKLIAEKKMYRNAEAEWWSSYGSEVPVLKKFAIKVLSLMYRVTGCERNWCIFSLLNNKRRNRLDQARLNDLVYVKYNRKLKKRFDRHDVIESLLLNEIDESNEWLISRMYEDDPPRNDQSNVDELNYNLRSNDVYNSDTEEEDVEENESDHNEEGRTFDDDDDDDGEFRDLD